MVEQQQSGRVTGGHLSGDLTADGAAGTRDEDATPGQQVSYRVQVRVDLFASEQIFDAEVTQIMQADHAANDLADIGQYPHGHTGFVREVSSAPYQAAESTSNGENGLMPVKGANDCGQIVEASDDADAKARAAALTAVVVQQRNWDEPCAGRAQHVTHEHCPRFTGTEHDDSEAASVVTSAMQREQP